jgi:pyruvate decarboxylase
MELQGRQTVSIGEFIFQRLHGLGIRHILGVPGDFNLKLLDHIYKVPDLRWVGTCNELNAAYAADGYARIMGIGAFVTTFGVGELSAINGVAGAYSEQIPVIHVIGTTSRMMQKARIMIHHTLSENWDHTTYQRMSEPVRSASAFLTDETTAAAEIDRVLETAVKTRLPVYLFVPVDVSDIIIDAAPLMTPLDLEVRNTGREADEDEVVLEIVQLVQQATNPGIIVDMLVQRHGLVEETKSLIKLMDAPVSSPQLPYCTSRCSLRG